MKKKVLNISMFIATFIFLGGGAGVGVTQQAEQNSSQIKAMPVAVIDKIKIPYNVLDYAHSTYEGHAVTEAKKVTYKKKAAYRLRVDRDSKADDDKSYYLYFNRKWTKLLHTERTKSAYVAPVFVPADNAERDEPDEDSQRHDNSNDENEDTNRNPTQDTRNDSDEKPDKPRNKPRDNGPDTEEPPVSNEDTEDTPD